MSNLKRASRIIRQTKVNTDSIEFLYVLCGEEDNEPSQRRCCQSLCVGEGVCV